MKKSIITCLLFFAFVSNSSALSYNFESPETEILDGLTIGILSVDEIPLEIQAGTLDIEGRFILGGAEAALSLISPGSISSFPIAGGLGINSTLDGGTDLSQALEGINQEGLLFNFDPRFHPEILRLRVFGDVAGVNFYSNLDNGASHTSHGGVSSGSDVVFYLKPGIKTLSLNIAAGTDPAVFITSIESGGKVPEPVTILFLASGLIGLAVFGSKKFKKIKLGNNLSFL